MSERRKPRCPFCEIMAGRLFADVVRKWDDALAFVPINPVTPGHLLVVPRAHVETVFSSPDVSAATMRRVSEMVHGVERRVDPNDYNVITSAGTAATQTVMHLHFHLVPRRPGDGLHLPWTPPEEEMSATFSEHGHYNPSEWWVRVTDWDGQFVYEGPAPCPPELVTLTAEDALLGRVYMFEMTPLAERATLDAVIHETTRETK